MLCIIFKMGNDNEEEKAKPDFKDVESGPMDESNRECRDVICCLIFLANIGGMIYVTIHGYLNGNPDKIFRAVAGDGVICGEVGGAAQLYPYAYFYQPIASMNNRVCVQTCPTWSNNALSTLSCYPSHTGLAACSYDFTIS